MERTVAFTVQKWRQKKNWRQIKKDDIANASLNNAKTEKFSFRSAPSDDGMIKTHFEISRKSNKSLFSKNLKRSEIFIILPKTHFSRVSGLKKIRLLVSLSRNKSELIGPPLEQARAYVELKDVDSKNEKKNFGKKNFFGPRKCEKMPILRIYISRTRKDFDVHSFANGHVPWGLHSDQVWSKSLE